MSDAGSPMRLEPGVFRRLKLLIYLREINLSSEATLALIRRLETNSCRPEDYVVPSMPLAAPSKGRAARWGHRRKLTFRFAYVPPLKKGPCEEDSGNEAIESVYSTWDVNQKSRHHAGE